MTEKYANHKGAKLGAGIIAGAAGIAAMLKTINSQIQKLRKKKKTQVQEKTTPKHIIIKLLKTSDY